MVSISKLAVAACLVGAQLALSLSQSMINYRAIDPSVFDDGRISRTLQNLVSICGHLQNPELYAAANWANACSCVEDEVSSLVASKDVERGEILTLFPFQRLGVSLSDSADDTKWIAEMQIMDDSISMPDNRPSSAILKIPLLKRERYPYPIFDQCRDAMVGEAVLTRARHPGWLGHLASVAPSDAPALDANCQVLPLAGAFPLCALVATKRIERGSELIRSHGPDGDEEAVYKAALDLFRTYRNDIIELQGYTDMVYPTASNVNLASQNDADYERQSRYAQQNSRSTAAHEFYQINRNYPGMRMIHEDPDILAVDNFLSEDECERLIDKARSHLVPCVTKDPKTGIVQEDPYRTSTNTNLPRHEVPSIVQKLVDLARCSAEQLEILQVLSYTSGQYFRPHTDGFMGPVSACGFVQSARLVTIFCYLNDVPRGGATRFTKLGLEIKPRKGMAVLHFPTTLNFYEDRRTQHEGCPVEGDNHKWLLVTWVWMHARADGVYAESNLASLSSDVI